MAFDFGNNRFKPFEKKLWLSSPTMHGEELEYVTEAYRTNWMSTVGMNITEAERITCKYAVALSAGTAVLHLAMKLAGRSCTDSRRLIKVHLMADGCLPVI